MKKTFLTYDKPILTCMVQADNPDRIKELVDLSLPEGAEAFGMQFCRMKPMYRNRETYAELFNYVGDKPIYVTNYRLYENEGKSDETLGSELLELAECGATLCDVMGDLYKRTDGELTMDAVAIEKQKALIEAIHERGAEVIMSSHVLKYTPAERVLEIALEHEKRGADICKIVTYANSTEEQIENLRIINLLKENLKIPFLYLVGGEHRILRRLGGYLGCCMYLCIHELDSFSTDSQPLLRDVKTLRDTLGL